MAPPQISARVLRFIDEYIDTVPQLETLLMMYDDPRRPWTVAEAAARTYISHDEASRVLEALRRRGMIAAEGGSFRAHLEAGQERELVDEVARTYRSNLAHIATFIHEKPPAPLKEFARAFDFKKEH